MDETEWFGVIILCIVIVGFSSIISIFIMYGMEFKNLQNGDTAALPSLNITVDRIADDMILDTTGTRWKINNDALDLQLVYPGTNITIVYLDKYDPPLSQIIKIEGEAI